MKLIRRILILFYNKPYFLFFLLSALLLAPALLSGFFLDDYTFLQKLFNNGVSNHLFNLYTFSSAGQATSLIANGTLPWWSNPDFRMDFFRPLYSLYFSIDFLIFGKNPLGFHISLFILAFGILVIWYKILKLTLPERIIKISIIALITSGVFAFPVFYAAEGHSLLSTFFMLLALLWYILYRQNQRIYILFFSLLAMIAGLLSSEAAIGIFMYFICYEYFYFKNSHIKRFLNLLPFAIIVFIYLALYKYFNFGTNTDFYSNPFSDPLLFLKNSFYYLPSLYNKLYFGFFFQKYFLLNLIIFVILVFSIYNFIRKQNREALSGYLWLFISSILSLVPCLTATVESSTVLRILLPPMLGASVIVTSLIIESWSYRKQLFYNKYWAVFHSIYSIWLGLFYFLFSPALMLILPFAAGHFNQKIVDAAISVKLEKNCTAVVNIAAPNAMMALFIPTIRAYYNLPNPKQWYVLAENSNHIKFTELTSEHFILETKPNASSSNIANALFVNNKLQPGDKIQTNLFEAAVLNIENHIPSKIEFYFNQKKDDICWITLSPVENANLLNTKHT